METEIKVDVNNCNMYFNAFFSVKEVKKKKKVVNKFKWKNSLELVEVAEAVRCVM